MKRVIVVLAFLCAVAAPLVAQPEGSAAHVAVTTALSVDRVRAGSTVDAAVILTIGEGWHINSHTPTEDYLIGTSLDVVPPASVMVADIAYPAGKTVSLAFADKPLSVYEGKTVIYLSLKISDRASGADTLRARLRIQACNDQVCQAPSDIDVAIPMEFVAASEIVGARNEALFAARPAPAGAAVSENEIGKVFETRGDLLAFLAIFLVGLALNLTPCVYPMLSVTVSLFGAQTETKTGRVFLKALVYVLGIATMYSVLGVFAALTGNLFGSWMQSPWVNGGIALLLGALALSMFGVYQIQAPYWLTSRLGGEQKAGLVGIYLSGLVVGIFAAPCTGPAVVALLALVGSKGSASFGFLAFFILSMGLGLPYLILGTFSGLLKKIPRSGVWMMWVEHVFGTVLIGLALYYLLIAFAPKAAPYGTVAALFIGGIYLGFIDSSGNDKKLLRVLKIVLGLAAVGLAVSGVLALRKEGMEWEPYTPERVAAAKAEGKPVVIDFYADWCIPCLELEKSTFTNEEAIKESDGFVKLKVNLTSFDSPASAALRTQFAVAGVPTIVFLDKSGNERGPLRIIGYVDGAEFVRRLKETKQ